jgi:hypothetical protein
MISLTQFKGVYCSGIFIPDAATLTALSLLFEKVHLPNNVEIIKEFSKKYMIRAPKSISERIEVDIEPDNIFVGLNKRERATAKLYLQWGASFIYTYGMLFPEVFETKLFCGQSLTQPPPVPLPATESS